MLLHFLHMYDLNDPFVPGGYITITFKSLKEAEDAEEALREEEPSLSIFITSAEHTVVQVAS